MEQTIKCPFGDEEDLRREAKEILRDLIRQIEVSTLNAKTADRMLSAILWMNGKIGG